MVIIVFMQRRKKSRKQEREIDYFLFQINFSLFHHMLLYILKEIRRLTMSDLSYQLITYLPLQILSSSSQNASLLISGVTANVRSVSPHDAKCCPENTVPAV